MPLKKILTQDKLHDLYINQHLSDQAIADIYGCTDVAISKLRRKYQISTIRQFDRLRLNQNLKYPNIEEITDDQFWSEYLSMTIQDMSLKYGVSSLKVKTERKRRNLEMKSEYVSESFPEPTERQKEVFIGGLLGDGVVYPAAKGRAFYKESHSVNQDLYVKEVHRLLHPFSNPLSLYIEKRAGQNQLGFKTKSLPYLYEMRSVFYSDAGVKFLPVDFLKKNWKPGYLAYWYFGDGELKENLPNIGTSFKEGLSELVDFLNQTYDFNAYVQTFPSMPKMSFIRFKNRKSFFEVIAPYLTPDMIYKVPLEHRKDIQESLVAQFRVRASDGYNSDLKKYKSSLYSLLSQEEKEVWEKQIFDYYREKGFPYINMSRDLLNERLNRVKRVKTKVVGYSLEHKTVGSEVCKNFMPHIYEARVGKNLSPRDQWDDDLKLKNLILNRFKYAVDVSPANMRRGIDLYFKTVANFKPSISKWICENYGNSGTVYLPDAGFGGKLLGALVSPVQSIVCLDPLDKTIQGSKEMAQAVDEKKTCRFVTDCAEDYLPEDLIGKVDLVLSCPPYFDMETYADDETQSIKRYPSYKGWVEGFLLKSIENFHKLLTDSGVYAIVIGDKFLYDFQRCIEGKFFIAERYYVPLGSVFHKKEGKHLFKYESLLILKKGSQPSIDLDKPALHPVVTKSLSKVVEKSSTRSALQKLDPVKCIQAIQDVAKAGIPTSREIVKTRVDLFPFSTSSVEKHFGGWNTFLKVAGVNVIYTAQSDRDKIAEYRLMCQKHGRFLSFYELELLEKIPATRYKRMFNAGKTYSHLKDQLESKLLSDDVTFERWLDANFPN